MKSYYATQALIRYYGRLTQYVEEPAPEGSPGEYGFVRFRLGEVVADATKWKEPVHVAVANLRTIDVKTGQETLKPLPARAETRALYKFVKQYGPLTCGGLLHEAADPRETYQEDPVTFGKFQFVLRNAWSGDEQAMKLISGEDENGFLHWATFLHNGQEKRWSGVAARDVVQPGMWNPGDPIGARVLVRSKGIEVVASELWSFVRLLFTRDRFQHRNKVCANPSCYAPYFVQSRKGQLFCSHKCAVLINVHRFREREHEQRNTRDQHHLRRKRR